MTEYSKTCLYQLVPGFILLVFFMLTGNAITAFSCLYGSALMAAGSWELARRLQSGVNQDALQRSLYAGAVIRFVLVLVGLAIGYLIGLYLPAIAGGMFAAQVIFYMVSLRRYKSEAGDKGEYLG